MNFIEQANNLTANKYFFYFILVLAGSNVLGYLTQKDWKSVFSFIMLSCIMYHFTNNVALVLIVAIFGTSFLSSLLKTHEGIENMDMDNDNGDMEKLENIDSDLKNGIDALKETNGDVSQAKQIIKKHGDMKDKDGIVFPVQLEDKDIGPVPDEFSNTDFEPFSNYKHGDLDNAAIFDQHYDNLGQNLSEKIKQEGKYLNDHKINIHNSVSNMEPMMNTANNLLTGVDFMKYGKSLVESAFHL